MNGTLILYNYEEHDPDNNQLPINTPSIDFKELIELTRKVLGPSVSYHIDAFHKDLSDYQIVIFLTSFTSNEIPDKITNFAINHADTLKNLSVAFLCIGKNKTESTVVERQMDKLKNYLSKSNAIWYYLEVSELSDSTLLADKLIQLKRQINDTSDMPQEQLLHEIETILKSHNTCALTSGYGHNLRTTPIEYTYHNGYLYFLSEGGEKFANIYVNHHVSISVYEEYTSFSNLEGLQIEGSASMIPLYSNEYNEAIQLRRLSLDHIKKLPFPLNMFRVTPNRFQVLKSDFKKSGYSARQIINI